MSAPLPESPCRTYSQHAVMVGAVDYINMGKLRPEDEDHISQSFAFLVQGPAMAEDTICGATCPEGMATRIVKVLDVETQKLAVFIENVRWDAPFKEIYDGYRGTERHPANEEPKTIDTILQTPAMRGNERYAHRFPKENIKIILRQPTSVELRLFEASPLLAEATNTMKKSAEANSLSIREAAEYARVDERTIRQWLKTVTADGPMLKGAFRKGRLTRIPRYALDPYRKPAKAVRKKQKTPPPRPLRKAVKK